MAQRGERDANTRQRLLDAATHLFAEQGFRRVTVRAICRQAGANVAAVNYYFGDKLGLYKEIVRGAITAARGSIPGTDAPEDLSAEDRLRRYVEAFVPQVACPDGKALWMRQLINHEMQEPTPLAPWIAEQLILPRVRYLAGVVAELLGCPADDPRVRHCVVSVQAQCLFYMPHRFRSAALPGWRELSRDEVTRLAHHIAEFSLAGIRRMAEES